MGLEPRDREVWGVRGSGEPVSMGSSSGSRQLGGAPVYTNSSIPIPRSSWPKTMAGRQGSKSCCCCPASSAFGEQDPASGSMEPPGIPAALPHPSHPIFHRPSQLDAENSEVWAGSTKATSLETPEEMLVTSLGLHSLSGEGWQGPSSACPCSITPRLCCSLPVIPLPHSSFADSVSCSAIMSVGITSALLLHKYREVRQRALLPGFSSCWSNIPSTMQGASCSSSSSSRASSSPS